MYSPFVLPVLLVADGIGPGAKVAGTLELHKGFSSYLMLQLGSKTLTLEWPPDKHSGIYSTACSRQYWQLSIDNSGMHCTKPFSETEVVMFVASVA